MTPHGLDGTTPPSEQELLALLAGLPQLLWRSCDKGDWVWSSPQWLTFTGQTQAESHGEGWLDAVHPEDRVGTMAAWNEAWGHGQLEVDFRLRDAARGGYRWHRTRSNPGRNPSGQIVEWFGSTTDIDELKRLQERQQHLLAELDAHARRLESEVEERARAEARLLHEARHDGLTQLHNRRFLLEGLGDFLAVPGHAACTVLLLDLDRLKLVNNSLGRASGDLLLIGVADRLRTCVRPQDTLARLGSDEFAIVIAGAGVEEAGAMAEAIRESVSRPLWLGEKEIFCSCSIGIAVARPERTADALLRDAGIALNEAKRGGHGIVRFSDDMHAAATEALQLRTDLRRALTRDELQMHYQPICAIDTGRIVGMEALVRWRRGSSGLVPPGVFIPIAEETGLIHGIGHWVLRASCTQLRAWRDRFPRLSLRVNVNTSGEELKSAGFRSQLEAVLSETGLEPGALQLEITESIFLEQPEHVGKVLDDIRALGVRVALDDFGTGYSSLSYLDQYQFDTIKIDRSFVASMSRGRRTVAVIEAIVKLGEAVGLKVVAEGVEDEAQLQALRRAGCRLVQGYHLGRPMPASDLSELLHEQPAPSQP